MNEELAQKVRAAAAQSELILAAQSIRRDGGRTYVLDGLPLRPLYRDEIAHLEATGSYCADWSRVRVVDGFNWRRIHQCSFHGDVLLGRFSHPVRLAENIEFPAGLYHSTLADCVIGNDALIRDAKLLANYVVAEGAVLLDCGSIACSGRTAFGNGVSLPLGIESGGRDVPVYAEIDVDTAALVARSRNRPELLREYARAVSDYAAQATADRGIIERGAVVRNTPNIRNTYVGRHARIMGATLVADSTLLSNAEEPVRVESGACVQGALLQWGSHVDTLAIVERSVLVEHSHAERHGKVKNSLLGPNTGVAEGEVTACLLGPFVSFHHQALLIATLWPDGKGNVAYGANVGSNHTSKAPDQEFWPGEGMFLGLGVNIKFPADFTRAPYSIIACGVTCLPQKVLFPFSLLNAPSATPAGVAAAFNEIIPAWLLSDNLYTIKRNEGKYRARNRARRQQFEFSVFRSGTVDLMRDACGRLEAVTRIKEAYTERDIEGLGKNYLLEKYRLPAIEAYRFFIRYYALLMLKERVEATFAGGQESSLGSLLTVTSGDHRWEHARHILCEDYGARDVATALRELPAILNEIAHCVENSKAKDDERGQRIIDDYANVHVEAADDPFVRQTWDETRRLQREVDGLLEQLRSRDPDSSWYQVEEVVAGSEKSQ